MNRPARNERCPCGSGKKFKQCCIDRPQQHRPSGPAQADVNVEKAMRAAMNRGDHKLAIEVLSGIDARALRQYKPSRVDSLLGESYEQLGDVKACIASYERAVAHADRECRASSRPDTATTATTRFRLSRAYLFAGQARQAESIARAGLAVSKERWELRDVLALALSKQGRTGDAVKVYENFEAQRHDAQIGGAPIAAVRSVHASVLACIAAGDEYAPSSNPTAPETPPGVPSAATAQHPSGGWNTESVPALWTARCDIDRRDKITRDEFLNEYVYKNKPVLLRGRIDDWPAWERWSKSAMLAHHGDNSVVVRNSRDITDNNAGLKRDKVTMPLRQYVEQSMRRPDAEPIDVPYLFHTQKVAEILNDIRHPHFFAEDVFGSPVECRAARSHFYIGGAYSSVSFHAHVTAWNALLFGYKRWFLLPPGHFYGPTSIAMTRWMREHAGAFADTMLECVQEPGEVLFVPQHWYHAVLNISDCVGIAVEVGMCNNLFPRALEMARKRALLTV
jgi:hypothetical protein